MKHLSLVLGVLLAWILAGSAAAQVEVHGAFLDHVVGELPNDRLLPDSDIQFHIRVTSVGDTNCMINPSMGFRVYSDDGAEWINTTMTTTGVGIDTIYYNPDPYYLITDTITFDELFAQYYIEGMGVTGNMADSIGFVGITMGSDPGVYDGLDTVVMYIQIHPTLASDEKHICLDIAEDMPAFEWEWTGLGIDEFHDCPLGDFIPDWSGPFCWEVWIEKDEPPVFDNPPASVSGSHCETLTADFDAYDPDPSMGPGPNTITFSLGAGSVGSINPGTGVWTWTSDNLADVGTVFDVWVIVTEGDGPVDSVLMTATVTNDAPYFTAGCNLTYDADVGDQSQVAVDADDNCPGDPISYFVADDGGATGPYSLVGNVLSYTPAMADLGVLAWQMGVTDGVDTGYCPLWFDVTIDEPPEISGDFSLTGSHCETVSYTYVGVDPDGSDAVTFSMVSGVGSITSVGVYSYTGSMVDVGVTLSAVIRAQEADGEYTDQPLTIDLTNAPPGFTSGCAETYDVNIDDEYEIVFTASDICPSDPMSFYIVDDAGAVGSYGLVGGVLTYTPDGADAGVHVWTIGVTDDKDSSSCTFTFDVTPDDPPEITGDLSLVGSHCETISHTYTGTDPDGDDPVTFSLIAGVGNITGGGMYTYEPSMGDVGVPLSATIRAQESDGEYTDAVINITVTNTAPEFTSGCGATYDLNYGDEYEIVFTADDICPGDPMTFSVLNDDGAAGAYGFVGGLLTYTPDAADEGVHVWTIGVSDGRDSSSCTVTFDVTPDDPPAVTGPSSLSGSHCQTISGTYTGYDTDGSDAVTFSLIDGVGEITTGGAYTYTPGLADVGVALSATIRATEADGEYADAVISVTATNAPPVFSSGCGQTHDINIDDEYQFAFTASDICAGDPMNFFVADDDGCVGDYGFVGGTLTFTPDIVDWGVRDWTIGVTDTKDTSLCTVTFDITMDDPPEVTGSTALGGSHCQTISETYEGWDSDGPDEVTFYLMSGVGSITTAGVYTYHPSMLDVGEALTATIRAYEADGEYTELVVTLTITNEAPQFVSGCDQQVLARTDRETRVAFEADDICAGDPITFFVIDDAGTHGTYSFEGNELSYYATDIDEGWEVWTIGVTDEVDTSSCTIEFEVFVGCCGLYTGGYTGNADYSPDGKVTLADISRMIDLVFISKAPLICAENGNTNGSLDGLCTLADISRAIDHVFISKAPCAPCP